MVVSRNLHACPAALLLCYAVPTFLQEPVFFSYTDQDWPWWLVAALFSKFISPRDFVSGCACLPRFPSWFPLGSCFPTLSNLAFFESAGWAELYHFLCQIWSRKNWRFLERMRNRADCCCARLHGRPVATHSWKSIVACWILGSSRYARSCWRALNYWGLDPSTRFDCRSLWAYGWWRSVQKIRIAFQKAGARLTRPAIARMMHISDTQPQNIISQFKWVKGNLLYRAQPHQKTVA